MTGSDTHGGRDKRPPDRYRQSSSGDRVIERQSFRFWQKHISQLAPKVQPNPHVTLSHPLIGSNNVKFKKPARLTNALAEGHSSLIPTQ